MPVLRNGLSDDVLEVPPVAPAPVSNRSAAVAYVLNLVRLEPSEPSSPVTMTYDRNVHYSLASGDQQWIHLNQDRAAELPGGKLIVPAKLVGAIVAETEKKLTTSFYEKFPAAQLLELSFSYALHDVVYVGDEVHTTYRIIIDNCKDRAVKFTVAIAVYKEGSGKPVAVGSSTYMLRAR